MSSVKKGAKKLPEVVLPSKDTQNKRLQLDAKLNKTTTQSQIVTDYGSGKTVIIKETV